MQMFAKLHEYIFENVKKKKRKQNKPLICGNNNLQGRYWDGGWKMGRLSKKKGLETIWGPSRFMGHKDEQNDQNVDEGKWICMLQMEIWKNLEKKCYEIQRN
jgi:hypothetical protein